MKAERKYRFAIYLLAVIFVLSHGGGMCMNNENEGDGSGSGITEDQARNLIYDFLKKEGNPNTKDYIVSHLETAGIKDHPNLGKLHMFVGELGEFWVSRQRGNVVNYNSPLRLTITEAENFAVKFISRHVPDFDNRNFKLINSEADDQFWKEEWREEPKGEREKSIFPNWISITINLEKRAVQNFNFSDLRRIRYTDPAIDEKKAREIIMERFPMGAIMELELVEHTVDGGVTWVTIWNSFVKPDDKEDVQHEIISIDADTGEEVPL